MKFSTRTTYGLRAMIYLARDYDSQKTVSLSQIAKDEHISLAYLERLIALLKRDGLVQSAKGKTGGYRLIDKPSLIDVFRIVKTLEGNVVPFHCIDADGRVKCAQVANCGASSVLMNVYVAISKTLKEMKLSELL